MARKKFVAGNWKMNKTAAEAKSLAQGVRAGLGSDDRVTVALCPPFPYLMLVAEAVQNSPIVVGAQDVYDAVNGAFTGEVSPGMLKDAGCQYVIVGHSERRSVIGEKDEFLNRKAKFALDNGLKVIFCIGETLAQRDSNQTESILDNQLTQGLRDVPAKHLPSLVVAYEPVWAIGTGRNATPEQAQQAHVFIRWRFSQLFGHEAAQTLVIQYGGSVKPDNAKSLLSQPDVDGALVGNASLEAKSFLEIIAAGR